MCKDVQVSVLCVLAFTPRPVSISAMCRTMYEQSFHEFVDV